MLRGLVSWYSTFAVWFSCFFSVVLHAAFLCVLSSVCCIVVVCFFTCGILCCVVVCFEFLLLPCGFMFFTRGLRCCVVFVFCACGHQIRISCVENLCGLHDQFPIYHLVNGEVVWTALFSCVATRFAFHVCRVGKLWVAWFSCVVCGVWAPGTSFPSHEWRSGKLCGSLVGKLSLVSPVCL